MTSQVTLIRILINYQYHYVFNFANISMDPVVNCECQKINIIITMFHVFREMSS